MKNLIILLLIFISTGQINSQHCEPICNSYLNGIELSLVGEKLNELNLNLSFFRNGGPVKEAHQIYIILFDAEKEKTLKKYLKIKRDSFKLQKNRDDKFFKEISEFAKLLDKKVISKINTEAFYGIYHYKYSISKPDLHKFILKSFDISDDELEGKVFKLFIVIPFLSSPYSDMTGLTEDKHDCNDAVYPYLSSSVLPYQISFIKYAWIQGLTLTIKNI